MLNSPGVNGHRRSTQGCGTGDVVRVKVNDELCQGHGLCRLSAPDLFFAREEDGNAYVKDENVPPGREADAQLAADSCPELAIPELAIEVG
jgi:ferredoxin